MYVMVDGDATYEAAAAPALVPALVDASNVKWLQIPRVYLNLPALRFCTAHAKPKFFKKLRTDPQLRGLIQRYELGLPVGHHARGLAPQAVARACRASSSPSARSRPCWVARAPTAVETGPAGRFHHASGCLRAAV